MTDAAPPGPTGKPPKAVKLTGKLFPWRQAGILRGCPALLNVPGSNDLYLPCFSDDVSLRAMMAQAGAPFDSIKYIQDESEFLVSIPRAIDGRRVRIMLDPKHTAEGKIRWTEVRLD